MALSDDDRTVLSFFLRRRGSLDVEAEVEAENIIGEARDDDLTAAEMENEEESEEDSEEDREEDREEDSDGDISDNDSEDDFTFTDSEDEMNEEEEMI